MFAKTDWKKLEEKFATKEDLQREIKSVKDLMIEFKDAILHEIKGLREEVTIVTGYKDQIEDHEVRLDSIEKKLQIPAAV